MQTLADRNNNSVETSELNNTAVNHIAQYLIPNTTRLGGSVKPRMGLPTRPPPLPPPPLYPYPQSHLPQSRCPPCGTQMAQ